MQLSNYQQGILNFILNETGHGACNAVAGSGKSTTLRIVAQELEKNGLNPSQIKVIVFGKANSLDLIDKFGDSWKSSISTLHSAGWSLLKDHLKIKNPRGLIIDKKYKKIAENLDIVGHKGNQFAGTLKRERAIANDDDFLKACDFLRLTNSEPTMENLRKICSHFNIDGIFDPATVAGSCATVLSVGERHASIVESFDFTDQIWLPIKWGLKPYKPYKFVLVDECQDLNAAQLELALNLTAEDGRLLFVGDPRQAIMGFAGADNESYNKIVKRTNATELPLSVCYRCPKKVIKLVKSLYPTIPIEPFENAVLGEIKQIKTTEINDYLKVGDLVLSRKTAPLVSLCIKLIAKGIAATVKGRAIGEQIKRDLEDIGKIYGFRYEDFNDFLQLYKKSKAERYQGLDNEERLLEDLKDKCEALQTIYSSQTESKSIKELGEYIDKLFSDESSPITLSTAHRAKGLENERVFLIRPEDMPLTWRDQKDWEHEQECNLHYVALTRAKSELFIVGNCSWYEEKEEEPETIDEDVRALESSQGSGETFDGSDADTDDQWECENCGHWNTPGYDDCYKCGALRTEQQTDSSQKQLTPFELGLKVGLSIPLEQMTNDQKREKVEELIKANPKRSSRAIASELGFANSFISKVRKELSEAGEIEPPDEVLDQKGRLMNVSQIKGKRKPLQEKVELLIKKHQPSEDEVKELILMLQNYLIF